VFFFFFLEGEYHGINIFWFSNREKSDGK